MYGGQFDGGASSSSLFSGGGFMPSQATQTPESSFSKSRGGGGVLPLTVKQISEALHSNDDKSNFAVDGVDATNVKLLGIVMNKAERVTDVSFTLDDGTGKIDVNRWVNETSETDEMALTENGMYVAVNGSLKGFQGKKHVVAFSVRRSCSVFGRELAREEFVDREGEVYPGPVVDFDAITLHFIECIHVHLENTRPKGTFVMGTETPIKNEVKGYQTHVPNHVSPYSATAGQETNSLQLVLHVFQEPASLAREHGLHIDEVVQRLRLPVDKIRQLIDYHVDMGTIYSTIDDNHFKSAMNG